MDVDIRIKEDGTGAIRINGEEMGGRVMKLSIKAEAGEPPIVNLELVPTTLTFAAPATRVVIWPGLHPCKGDK